MKKMNKCPKIDFICSACGSSDVSSEGWVRWNIHRQEWELGSTYGRGYCDSCKKEVSLKEVELP